MKYLFLVLTLIFVQISSSQEVTISQSTVTKIKKIQSELTMLNEQNKYKDIILTTLKLAKKLPKEQSTLLLQSEYFIDAKNNLKKITAKNLSVLNKK